MTIKEYIEEKELKVVSIKGEVFTNQYITLANNRNASDIKEKYLNREFKRIEQDKELGIVLIS